MRIDLRNWIRLTLVFIPLCSVCFFYLLINAIKHMDPAYHPWFARVGELACDVVLFLGVITGWILGSHGPFDADKISGLFYLVALILGQSALWSYLILVLIRWKRTARVPSP